MLFRSSTKVFVLQGEIFQMGWVYLVLVRRFLLLPVVSGGKRLANGSRFPEKYPCQTRSRSVPDVAVLNSQPLTGLLIKYQRLPRGFLWNTSLPPLNYRLFYFLKRKFRGNNRIER